MNLPNHLTDHLIYLRLNSQLQQGLSCPRICFKSSALQPFLFCYQTPSGNSLFVGTAKVRIFLLLSSFLKTFFSFLQLNKPEQKTTTILTRNLSKQPLYISLTHFPSSEAGCKSKKNIHHPKQIITFICIKSITPCKSIRKNINRKN